MRKALGILLISLPFAGFLACAYAFDGLQAFLVVLAIFAGAGFIALVVLLGMALCDREDD